MKQKLSTQLAAGFALIVLITISVISLTANLCISRQFEKYIEAQQKSISDDIASGLSHQYNADSGTWNLDYIHGYGMYALGDGYIVKVCDSSGQMVWDAENHDMTLCHQVMENISLRMEQERPELEGDFVTHSYDLEQGGAIVGTAEISYYSPYYFNENDFQFLTSLNRILVIIGVLSVAGAMAAGIILARRIAAPISKTTYITKEISEGNYGIQFETVVKTRELSELTQAVNQMASSLARQEALRRRLTTDVAHELRTPLANVSSHLELMQEGVWEPTPERLQSCYDEISRITQLVSDLERLRQVESQNPTLEQESVDLLELARSVCTGFEAELKAKNLTCTVEGETAVVRGDESRLRQVMTNLMSNAVKYSHEGGAIHVYTDCDAESGKLVVEDEGIGIPEEELPLIFERFYRTDRSRSRKTGGAGIGLTIAKSIVQAHGGSVTAQSGKGRGSRFTVVLPR